MVDNEKLIIMYKFVRLYLLTLTISILSCCKTNTFYSEARNIKRFHFEKYLTTKESQILYEVIYDYNLYLANKYPKSKNRVDSFLNDWQRACDNQDYSFIQNDSSYFRTSMRKLEVVGLVKQNNNKQNTFSKTDLFVTKWIDSIHSNNIYFDNITEYHTDITDIIKKKELNNKKNFNNRKSKSNYENILYVLYKSSLESDKELREYIEHIILGVQVHPCITTVGITESFPKEKLTNPLYKAFVYTQLVIPIFLHN